MVDTQGICVIVNRDKLDDYERKKLKEVVEDLKNRELGQKIYELYGDIGEKNFKVQVWNNYAVLLIELDPKYLFDEDNEERDELVDLRDFILKKYGKVFIKQMMEGNILIIGGHVYRDNITSSSSEILDLPKDKLSELGKLVFDAIAEKNDCEGAFRLISELYLKNKNHQLDTTLKIGDVDIFDDSMVVKLKIGKEKLYRVVKVKYDEENSKPSKIVFTFESQHYDHLIVLKKLLKSLLIKN